MLRLRFRKYLNIREVLTNGEDYSVNVIFGTQSIAHVAELIAEAFLDGKRHIRTNEH